MRINWGRFFRSIILLGLIGYVIYRLAMGFLLETDKTFTAVYEKIDIPQVSDAIIFRNELVVHTNIGGDIRYNAVEGDRVKKGLKVADITRATVEEPLEGSSPEETDQSVQALTVTEDQIEEQIALVVEQLLIARTAGDMGLTTDLKEELDLKIERKNMLGEMVESSQGYAAAYVGTGAEGQTVSFYSPKSGIITYYSDGMESILTTDNLYKLDYEAIMDQPINVRNLTAEQVQKGAPVYKIVDNSVWMMVALVDRKDLNLYEQGRRVVIEMDEERVNGTISKVFETGERGAIVLKITEQMSQFHRQRLVTANVIREQYQGLKIPRSALITQDDITGVYMLGLDNRAVFKPVSVIGYHEEFAVVKTGITIDVLEDGETVQRSTIEINDEVLIDGAQYREGDTIYN